MLSQAEAWRPQAEAWYSPSRPLLLASVVALAIASALGAAAAGQGEPPPAEEIDREFRTLQRLLASFQKDAAVRNRWQTIADQAVRPESLILAADRDPADVALRRAEALLAHLEGMAGAPDLSAAGVRLAALRAEAVSLPPENADARRRLFADVLAARRQVALANPLLDFDRLLFVKRHFLPGRMLEGNHMCDQFFGFHAVAGGGVFVLENAFRTGQAARDLLAHAVCENGRFRGRRLQAGAFLAPDVSFDGRTVLFAYTEGEPTRYRWTERSTYHIFKIDADGSGLVQLTDGPVNDLDPCWMPDGRIAFISERRGGFGRCHPRPVPLFTLHAMDQGGAGIVRLSHHEANEWQPSIAASGLIVYTRWDYTDRGNIQAHHPWLARPDGGDARALQGNFGRTQGARPTMELDVRAIPGCGKYVATAAAHHGQAYGSLVVIDPNVPDDDGMGPLRRLTPEAPFPEAEAPPGQADAYAAAWPLDEYFYLCVYDPEGAASRGPRNNHGIYLLDAFGNKELIYRDPQISCLGPMPLRPRARPPVLADAAEAPAPPGPLPPAAALVSVVNVYDSRLPFPAGASVRALRIVQVLPKTTPLINQPRIGYGNEKGARAVLGSVPVEADGSASFLLPAGVPVYFQALDEQGLAVQSMRSDTYAGAGRRLFCQGCHEPRSAAPPPPGQVPLALRRPPSVIQPEVDGANPFSFPRLVQPVLARHCIACHEKEAKAPDLRPGEWQKHPHLWYASYANLRDYAFFYGATRGDYDPWTPPRTEPGKFGARASRLYPMLRDRHHDVNLPPEDLRRVALWLDCNSDFFGSYENTEAQARGQVVRPALH